MAGVSLEDATPEQLRAYVKALRQEAGDLRVANQGYEASFSRLTPEEQRGMLHLVKTYSEDKVAAADLFRQVADLHTQPGEAPGSELDMIPQPANPVTPAVSADPEVAALKAKIEEMEKAQAEAREEVERQQQQVIIDEITTLGYAEGTDRFERFVNLARSEMAGGRIAEAHRLFPIFYPDDPGANVDADGNPVSTPPAAGAPPIPVAPAAGQAPAAPAAPAAPSFPLTSGQGSSGGPNLNPVTEAGADVDLSLAAVSARALAQLKATSQDGS